MCTTEPNPDSAEIGVSYVRDRVDRPDLYPDWRTYAFSGEKPMDED